MGVENKKQTFTDNIHTFAIININRSDCIYLPLTSLTRAGKVLWVWLPRPQRLHSTSFKCFGSRLLQKNISTSALSSTWSRCTPSCNRVMPYTMQSRKNTFQAFQKMKKFNFFYVILHFGNYLFNLKQKSRMKIRFSIWATSFSLPAAI